MITSSQLVGFINAFEDDILAPLRLIWMRMTDTNIPLSADGTFDVRTALSAPLVEMVSVWSSVKSSAYNFQQPFDRKDISTFRRLQSWVGNEPIYTIDNALVRVWPPIIFNGYLNCSYYTDFARLGDLVITSTLQTQTLTLSGTASNAGSLTFSTGATNPQTTTIVINTGESSVAIANRIALTAISYAKDEGGNITYWASSNSSGTSIVSFTAPVYVDNNVSFTVTQTGGTGLSFTNVVSQNATRQFVQTNWFLQNYPYLYYYGALKHLFLYLANAEMAGAVNQQTLKMVDELQSISDRADASDASDGFFYNQEVQW
ncbi:MAG: hypothetical protein ORN54_10240 [Cyclobacteriaceae bacterium]|nr:hypothetical protein [Cyclobacteriaceae bacterium]